MSEWPELRFGDQHHNVRTLQHLLNYRGADLEVDGVFGGRTEEALGKFQHSAELEPDGRASAPVWLLLITDLSMGDRGEAVKAAQVQLLYRRTLPDVDGAFGMKTDISVRRFQVLKRLAADGVINSDTWREMLADELLPGGPPGSGEQKVDPSDWRAQLLSKLRPGGSGPPGFPPAPR